MDERERNALAEDFESAAAHAKSSSLKDFFSFLAHNKKWWLLPLVIVLIGLGAVAVLGGTAAAPFIYTLF